LKKVKVCFGSKSKPGREGICKPGYKNGSTNTVEKEIDKAVVLRVLKAKRDWTPLPKINWAPLLTAEDTWAPIDRFSCITTPRMVMVGPVGPLVLKERGKGGREEICAP